MGSDTPNYVKKYDVFPLKHIAEHDLVEVTHNTGSAGETAALTGIGAGKRSQTLALVMLMNDDSTSCCSTILLLMHC